ncbi:AAA family ATPase [Actinocorallia longicatena]|uniref:AAA domain-containing protein n=1 Tax=Actinocorallia longicatena TaxID=111803 RepID=A0ABP6QM25_9ACTN
MSRKTSRTKLASFTTAGCGICNPQGWIEDADGKPIERCPVCHPSFAPTIDSPARLLPFPALAADPAMVNEPQPPNGRKVKLTRASEIRMRPARWLWESRVPIGSLTVIPGREGIGKSLLLCWMAAQITRGALPGFHQGTPRPVIYAASEDSWAHTIAPRLYAAGADLDLVYRAEVEHAGNTGHLSLPRDCDGLAEQIRDMGVALLAADPLLSLIASGIDTHKDRELRTALEPLVQLADSTDCAVIGLAHFNKSSSTDALNLITGSRAFSAVSRAVVAVAQDPQDDEGACVLSQAKNNLGRADLPSLRFVVRTAEVPTEEGPASVGVLEFTGESDRSVADILAENGRTPAEPGQTDETADWIIGYLTAHSGQAAYAEIAAAAKTSGIAERTLKRARQRAGVTSVRTGFPAITVWRLPASADQTAAVGPFQPQDPEVSGTGPTGPTGPAGTPDLTREEN